MMHDRQINDPAMQLRMEWANSLAFVLRECNPDDAAAICVAFLEEVETGGPRHDPFGMVYSDAGIWAVAAPPHELVAYTLAGLKCLSKAHLSLPARKRVFMQLWRSFPPAVRAAFLKYVKGDK